MSGKQNKRLRKIALGLAASVSPDIKERGILIKNHKQCGGSWNPQKNTISFENGVELPYTEVIFAQQAINDPKSLRGIVRSLKKCLK
jgi:hypothetical protein